jgi:hypothetical protein
MLWKVEDVSLCNLSGHVTCLERGIKEASKGRLKEASLGRLKNRGKGRIKGKDGAYFFETTRSLPK